MIGFAWSGDFSIDRNTSDDLFNLIHSCIEHVYNLTERYPTKVVINTYLLSAAEEEYGVYSMCEIKTKDYSIPIESSFQELLFRLK